MKGNTSCWECSAIYPITMDRCPACLAANANILPDEAKREVMGAGLLNKHCECNAIHNEYETGGRCASCGGLVYGN